MLCEGKATPVAGARQEQDSLWIPIAGVEDATGWALEPEGLCRGEIFVPLPSGASSLLDGETLKLSAFWRHLGRPVVHDKASEVWLLGGPTDRDRRALSMLEAPDVTLPDLDGRLHSLNGLSRDESLPCGMGLIVRLPS